MVVGYTNTARLTQTVGPTVQLGITYTLMVDLGWRKDTSTFVGQIDLRINNLQYLGVGTAPVQGGWSTFTATYTGLLADVGQPIIIELTTGGIITSLQGDYDNIRLNDSAPEPSSAFLFGTALCALAAMARRKWMV